MKYIVLLTCITLPVMIFIFTMMNPLFNVFTLWFKACHLCKQTRNILRKNFKHIVKLSSLINRVNSSRSLTVFFFFSVLCLVLVVAAVVVIGFSVWEQPSNLVSISGYIFFLFILLICSAHPTKVGLWRRHLVHGYPLINTINVNVQGGAVNWCMCGWDFDVNFYLLSQNVCVQCRPLTDLISSFFISLCKCSLLIFILKIDM